MTKQELFNKADYYKALIERNKTLQVELQGELDNHFRNGFTLDNYEYSINKIEWEAGLGQAYEYMLSIAGSEQLELTEDVIKKLHYLICYNIDIEQAGQYRKSEITILAGERIPPQPEDVAHLMEHFINQMITSRRFMHPIEIASMCLKRLTEIHPFMYANGIVTKLFINIILKNAGYGITLIPPVYESELKKALVMSQKVINPDIDVLIKYVAQRVVESELEYCRLLNINDIN